MFRGNERLGVRAREWLRSVRQEPPELYVIAIGERVLDVVGSERTKQPAARS